MTTLPSSGEMPEELVAEARRLMNDIVGWFDEGGVEEIARALMAERERAAREERERIVTLLTAILDVFTRCGIDNDWTALLTTLSAAILSDKEQSHDA